MPTVVFIHPDGWVEAHRGRRGESVMDVALDHEVAGIAAQCGGGCTCSTCHCYVAEAWRQRIEPPAAEELEILAYVPDRKPGSRLSCQIFLDDDLDGLVVHVPPPEAPPARPLNSPGSP